MVPLSQIRALSPEQMQHASNRRSEGFWNAAPASMGGGHYRIVNNTATCVGPWLAIFRDTPPQLEWLPIPGNWIVDGAVRLCVAKGTLVPATTLRSGHPQATRGGGGRGRGGVHLGGASRDERRELWGRKHHPCAR